MLSMCIERRLYGSNRRSRRKVYQRDAAVMRGWAVINALLLHCGLRGCRCTKELVVGTEIHKIQWTQRLAVAHFGSWISFVW